MKKLLVLMLAVLMCLTLVATVACKPDEPPTPSKVELDITKGWKGNEEEETYTISDANGLTISYEKSGMWQYCRRVFLNETPEDLQKVKTLVIVGKMQADTYNVTLKFEYNEDLPAQEVTFRMSDTEATYEWDVSNMKLDKAARILLFAEGSRSAGNGTITLSKMVLTEDAINAANDVTKQPAIEVPRVTNEITAENHSFNANWYDNDGAFTAVTADGKTTVTKMAGGGWAALKSDVKGAEIANMKTIRLTFKGTAGDFIIVKPFDNAACEVHMEGNVTGGSDTIVCDIAPALVNFDPTATYSIIILYNWDAATQSNFVIESAEFSDDPYVNNITAENGDVAHWYDNGDGNFSVATVEGKTTVTKKANGSWSTLKADVTGEGLATRKNFEITLSGVEGDVAIVKLEGNGVAKEFKLEPASTEDTVKITLDLSDVELDVTKVYNILIFFNWDATEDTTFVIESAKFVEAGKIDAKDYINNITAENGKVINWYDGGEGKFSVVESNGRAEVSKVANGSWAQFKLNVSGEGLATRNNFKINLSGIQGDVIIVKLEGNGVAKEVKIDPASTEDVAELTLDLSDVELDATKVYNILIFFNWDAAEETSFVIESAEFVVGETPTPVDPQTYVNDITAANGKINNWYDAGEGKFTVAEKDGRAEVSKLAGGGWAQLKINVSGEGLAARKYFRIRLTDILGDVIIVKLEGNGVAKEVKIDPASTVDATVLTLDLTDLALDATKVYNIIIFFNWDAAADTTFVIESAEFVSSALNNITAANGAVSGWYDNGDGNFTLVEADGKVTATKKANGSWSSVKLDVTGAGLLTNRLFKINLSGVQGDVAIVKLEGNGVAKEVKIDPASTEDAVELTLDLTGLELDASKVYNILIFFNMDSAEETSFVIESAQFEAADTPAPVEPKDYVNDITAQNGKVINWYDGGESKFTATVADGKTTVTKVGGGNWAQFKLNVSGEGLATRKYFRIALSDILNDVIIVKLEGNGVSKEIKIDPASKADTAILSLDLSDLTLDATKVYNIIIFFNWDAADETSFVIESAEFVTAALNNITAENLAVSGWYDNGDGNYTLATAEGKTTVTKKANGSWSTIKADVTGAALATAKSIKVELSGVLGDVVIFKLEGNGASKEIKIDPASTEDTATLTLDLTGVELDATKVYNILIFLNWDATVETGLVIESAQFVE